MQKIRTLLTDSAREFRSIRTIALCGVFAAMAFLLEQFVIPLPFTRVGFSGLPNEIVDVLFGPALGSVFSGMLDVFKLILSGSGSWNPGLTFNAFLAGAIYGVFWYKKPISFWRILLAKLIVAIFVNVILGTLWLLPYYEKGYFLLLPSRLIKNLINAPIDSIILYFVLYFLNVSGVFRIMNIYIPKKKKKENTYGKSDHSAEL